MKAHSLSGLAAAVVTVVLVSAALLCTGCLQELPLGDKYINEAAGFLRVRNTSAMASYIFTALELRDADGKTVQSWDALGQDGQGLQKGETWTGDVGREGSFALYCTVATLWNDGKKTEEVYKYGDVEIKPHEVTESKIMGETLFTDTDGDGFSDSWETRNGFNPNDKDDGGPVYVSSTATAIMRGTKDEPYSTLFAGVEKAKSGLTEEARTVVVTGELDRENGNPGSDTAVMYITDTGPYGVTVMGGLDTSASIDVNSSWDSQKSALYLGPGTKLTLKNITIQGGYAYRGGGVHAKGAELTLGAGAVIRNCIGSAGGGVYGTDGAVIVMESGSLIGGDAFEAANRAINGEGAAVGLYNGSSLTMKSGSRISANYAARGGTVNADLESIITLEGDAAITGNSDAISPSAQIITNGGGGVRLDGKSRMIMTGGLIAFNEITKGGGGGGVYISGESVLDMRGGEIRANVAGEKSIDSVLVKGNGGGVYVGKGSVFLMSGGEIATNTAAGSGGGVYVNGGSIAKEGGFIYGSDDVGDQNTMGGGAANAFFIGLTGECESGTLSGSYTYHP